MQVSGLTMRRAQVADAATLAAELRESDRIEMEALRPDVEDTLRQAIAMSAICDVAECEAGVVLVIGCAVDPLGRGVPWLVGTDLADAHPGALTKIGKRYVAMFLERWPVLFNMVDARNTVRIRWLESLGFAVGEPIEAGRNGEQFRLFTMGV